MGYIQWYLRIDEESIETAVNAQSLEEQRDAFKKSKEGINIDKSVGSIVRLLSTKHPLLNSRFFNQLIVPNNAATGYTGANYGVYLKEKDPVKKAKLVLKEQLDFQYMTPSEVLEMEGYLTPISIGELYDQYDFDDESERYLPLMRKGYSEEVREYIIENFELLKAFFQRAVKNGDFIVSGFD